VALNQGATMEDQWTDGSLFWVCTRLWFVRVDGWHAVMVGTRFADVFAAAAKFFADT
jgi:hypothetical protein